MQWNPRLIVLVAWLSVLVGGGCRLAGPSADATGIGGNHLDDSSANSGAVYLY